MADTLTSIANIRSGLADGSTCTYNTVNFGSALWTRSLSIRQQYDASGRTVAYNVYRLVLVATIDGSDALAGGDSRDDILQNLRQLLSQPGGQLEYTGKGLGNDLRINLDGSYQDCIWGPKPALLSYESKGQLSARIEWEVSFAIKDCPGVAQYGNAGRILEYCFGVEWHVDRGGYTNRVVSGFVRIPQTRAAVGARTLTDQADRLREQITPAPIPGFRRIPGDFRLSLDKCRLDFTITDEQLPWPNVPPPGVVEVDFSHRIHGDFSFGGIWHGQMQASFELAPGTPRSKAWSYFLATVFDRLQYSTKQQWHDPSDKNKAKPGMALVIEWDLGESLYSRKSATFGATFIMTADVSTILQASGLFTPVPNSDWVKWKTSLAASAFNPRGSTGLRFNPNDDVILDLCTTQQSRTLSAGGAPPGGQARVPKSGTFRNATPPAASSWLSYRFGLTIARRDHTVPLVPLPSLPVGQLEGIARGSSSAAASPTSGARLLNTPAASLAATKHQRRAEPTYYAIWTGAALRAGGTTVPPEVKSVAGRKATPCDLDGDPSMDWNDLAGDFFGVQLYLTRWRYYYLLDGDPGPSPSYKLDRDLPNVPGG